MTKLARCVFSLTQRHHTLSSPPLSSVHAAPSPDTTLAHTRPHVISQHRRETRALLSPPALTAQQPHTSTASGFPTPVLYTHHRSPPALSLTPPGQCSSQHRSHAISRAHAYARCSYGRVSTRSDHHPPSWRQEQPSCDLRRTWSLQARLAEEHPARPAAGRQRAAPSGPQ